LLRGAHVLEGRRRIFGQFSREDLGADGRMRANENALAALRAQVGFEHRNLQGQIALFVFGGAERPRTIGREQRNRQRVALAGDHRQGQACGQSR
jgi:hypothetical protein